MNPQRSASVGALPRERKHFVSRTESSSGASLDVRCACQYFESDSLLPERINPVDSRPSSKLGFHSEIDDWQGSVQHASAYPDQQHLQQSFHPMNLDAPSYQADNLSTRSFNAADTREDHPCAPMRSLGGQRSLDQASSPTAVDLNFVKKYPELEEAVRSRGLVVRSISGAMTGEPSVPGFGTFMAGHRRRQLSVGGLSAGSGMRDPDTISVRSVTSLRRISRSPSKGDLFVADINIPTTHADRREQHSGSGSRRTSNVDLSHFASHQKTQITTVVEPRQAQKQEQHPEAQTSPPQLNLITPTPSPGDNNLPPDFQKVTMLQTIEAQATSMQDYRVAKPPISTDYMRPTQNDDALKRSHQGGSLHPLQPENVSKSPISQKKVLPQNQPIDVSKYAEYVEPSTIEEDVSLLLPQHRPIDVSKCGELREKAAIEEQHAQMLPAPITVADRLQQEVTALEEATATRSIIEICDKIQSESYRPPSLAEDVSVLPNLHLDEQTQIDIESSLPVVDINELVRNEENKASQVRQKSPPRSITPQNKAPQTLQRMDTLQLPDTRTHSRDIRNQTQGYLKRQHTPESETPSESHKRSMIQSQPHPTVPHAVTSPDAISFENTSNEAKPTYASRFMSMFKPKTYEQEALPGRQMELSPKREKTPSPKREKTPSPKREKTPSPKREMTPSPKIGRSASPSRVKSMLIRNKPMAIEIVSGANAVIMKKPEAEPHAVKVTETFSLKVDDMDQYNAHPAKIPSVAPSITTPPLSMFSSRENFRGSGKISVDFSEAFTPVVFAPSNRDQFLAGNRSFYSSDIDMQTQQSESEVHGMPPTMVNGSKAALVSVPIFVGDNKELGHASISEGSQKFLPRAPSEQRFQSKMMPTSAFIEGRTQSQDRARTASSTEDIYGSRITKTVSFNFGERKSRLSEFENENVSQQTRNQKDFLERTYFAR